MSDIEDRILKIAQSNCKLSDYDYKSVTPHIASKKMYISEIEARCQIRLISNLFRRVCSEAGYEKRSIDALMRKFRDAGRRSAPWKPTSSVVPGRPQDGGDGNRILRWLLPEGHKFYATEVIATLVEIKYYLQALSMLNAPNISEFNLEASFTPWLLEHNVTPGEYCDPVQLSPINFVEFIENPRGIQSGHIHPLDRGGIHHPDNTFLMLFRSNQIQGNLTVKELLNLMRDIVKKHDTALEHHSALEEKIRES